MRRAATVAIALAVSLTGAASAATPAAAPTAPPIAKNIVIVPGAYIDASSWRVVHDILRLKGYKVTVAQLPHTSLDDDIAIARKAIFQQFGNVLLVGNGIGGTVMSNVASGDKVKGMVYVAGLAPEIGETSQQLLSSMPGASGDPRPDRGGFQYFDAARFHAALAADLTPNRVNFMAASQVPVSNVLMGTPSWFAMWHQKPSFGIVATQDRLVNPELQRWMYKRAGAQVTEIAASHAVQVSQPEAVAKVIEDAALSVL
ncbi:alpha/beta fold hydrolase [Pseudoduganella violaceinigra]|uniref:alpha/beta fold hydrolase n=1 Tax=Pseudoduganella violaceinigra TaxID=246602 RepID=UPI000427A4E4|nr:alpha/beta hydrolase [Pseudoduganella violaceinigra]